MITRKSFLRAAGVSGVLLLSGCTAGPDRDLSTILNRSIASDAGISDTTIKATIKNNIITGKYVVVVGGIVYTSAIPDEETLKIAFLSSLRSLVISASTISAYSKGTVEVEATWGSTVLSASEVVHGKKGQEVTFEDVKERYAKIA